MNDDPEEIRAETRRARPFVIEVEAGAAEADPGAAPVVPDATAAGAAEAEAMQRLARLARRRGGRFGRLALWVFGTLFSFVLSVAAWEFVADLFARNAVLGGVALVLVLAAVAVALVMALREVMGFARLARLDHLRSGAVAALRGADLPQARHVAEALRGLYAGRPEVSWGIDRFDRARPEVMDADALLDLAEAEILAPLDALARAEIEAAARRVTLVTALVPLALADVAAALYANVAMIRRVAEIYGGRSGALGSWSLLRKVLSALLAAGAVSLADDMVGSVAGGGVLSKLSRRFGEGVVNGALTARIGVAAMELCRPLPFRAVERPGVSALVSRALAGLVPRRQEGGAAQD